MGGRVAEQWRRYETDACDESAEPIAFDYWRSLEQAAITLGAGHGELLVVWNLPPNSELQPSRPRRHARPITCGRPGESSRVSLVIG
jgi:hypothetical protein